MLSAACHESLPSPPPEDPAPAAFSFRRLAVTFDNDDHNGVRRERSQRRRRTTEQTVTIPAYSRIVFRAGTVSVR
jgi:hypothetical protein